MNPHNPLEQGAPCSQARSARQARRTGKPPGQQRQQEQRMAALLRTRREVQQTRERLICARRQHVCQPHPRQPRRPRPGKRAGQ